MEGSRLQMSSQPPGSQPPSAPPQLPKLALDRLHRGQGDFFTSDLSVDEYLLIKAAGFHPRNQAADLSGRWRWERELVYLDAIEWKHILTAAFKQETIRLAKGINGGIVMLGHKTSEFSKKEFSEWLEFLASIEVDFLGNKNV